MTKVVEPISSSIFKVPMTSLRVLSYAQTVWVKEPKSEGAYPRAMAVARGQMFRAEPLSRRTDGTRRPEQPTNKWSGRVWSKPSSGKSSSKNTMHVALPTLIIWIKPLGMVVVSTLIWLRAWIKASRWVLEDANKLQIEIWAWVLCNCLRISSSSLLTSLGENVPSNGLAAVGGGRY